MMADPSSVRVVGKKRLLIIFSLVIAAVLITATLAILIVVLIKKNPTAIEEIPKTTTVTETKVTGTTTVTETTMGTETTVTATTAVRKTTVRKTTVTATTTTRKTTATATTTSALVTNTNNRYNETYSPQRIYSTGVGSRPWSVSVGDVNGDNKSDIIVANQLAFNVGVFFNSGNGTFLSQTTYPTDSNSHPQCVSVVDVNGDNKADIIVANNGANNVGVLLNSGNGTFLPQKIYSTGPESYPPSLTVADVNNDNKADIIVANQNLNNIGVLLNSGDGTFLPQTIYPVPYGSGVISPSVVDVNEDNKPDIIIANSGGNSVGIFFNLGNGKFLNQTTYPTGLDTIPQFVSVIDVNSDNKPDLIIANSKGNNVGVWFNAGNGTFLSQTTYSTESGSSPQSLSVADVNSDNQPDIIVANHDGNTVSVFLNLGNGTFVPQTTYSTGSGSNPHSVSVVDVNGDNKPDIIVANSGANNIGVFLAL